MRNVEPWELWQLPGGCLLYLHSRFGRLPDAVPQMPSRHGAAIMPFGKYRGAPLDAVRDDTAYADWLLRQRWFREQYPTHREYLLARTQADANGPGAA